MYHCCRLLRMQFIRAKYVRKEFVYPDKQSPYSTNTKTGQLLKRGKNGDKYCPRTFTINSKDNCIQYFNKPLVGVQQCCRGTIKQTIGLIQRHHGQFVAYLFLKKKGPVMILELLLLLSAWSAFTKMILAIT